MHRHRWPLWHSRMIDAEVKYSRKAVHAAMATWVFRYGRFITPENVPIAIHQ